MGGRRADPPSEKAPGFAGTPEPPAVWAQASAGSALAPARFSQDLEGLLLANGLGAISHLLWTLEVVRCHETSGSQAVLGFRLAVTQARCARLCPSVTGRSSKSLLHNPSQPPPCSQIHSSLS